MPLERSLDHSASLNCLTHSRQHFETLYNSVLTIKLRLYYVHDHDKSISEMNKSKRQNLNQKSTTLFSKSTFAETLGDNASKLLHFINFILLLMQDGTYFLMLCCFSAIQCGCNQEYKPHNWGCTSWMQYELLVIKILNA